ncbi:MAG: hypothetical protein QHH18_07945 [Candidatus Bathyarchaeota archaeon]|nr:hypothetical protein [Candidatus Bathyarchaeota archaeon A05DMB-5]MDH7558512.1 hypothetical protein [Candidatus Bathyarchaeota archaeon]
MYIESHVGVDVTPKDLQFVAGANFSIAGGWLNPSKTVVKFGSMTGGQGVNKTYYEPVSITNVGSSSHTFEMKFDSWTISNSSALEYITIAIYDESNALQGNMIYLPGNLQGVDSTGDVVIPANANWRIEWVIRWVSDAAETNTVDVKIMILVKN